MPEDGVGGGNGGWEGFIETQEMCNDDGYIYCINRGKSFMDIYILQALPNYIIKMCSLFCHLYFNKAEKIKLF